MTESIPAYAVGDNVKFITNESTVESHGESYAVKYIVTLPPIKSFELGMYVVLNENSSIN